MAELQRNALAQVSQAINQSRSNVVYAVTIDLIHLYWNIGRIIKTDIMRSDSAEYGAGLIDGLSAELIREYGRGYSSRNLANMVKFYEVCPGENILLAVSAKLAWTHLKGKTIKKFAEKNFIEGAQVETDACRSYRKTLEKKFLHEWQIFDADAEMLNWLHIVISNVKAALQGTYHGLDGKYLQRCFDEISYRFNRRHMERDIFDHLLSATTLAASLTLAELKG